MGVCYLCYVLVCGDGGPVFGRWMVRPKTGPFLGITGVVFNIVVCWTMCVVV